jgi:hypothetical protein
VLADSTGWLDKGMPRLAPAEDGSACLGEAASRAGEMSVQMLFFSENICSKISWILGGWLKLPAAPAVPAAAEAELTAAAFGSSGVGAAVGGRPWQRGVSSPLGKAHQVSNLRSRLISDGVVRDSVGVLVLVARA